MQPHCEEYVFAVLGSGRVCPGGVGTLVVRPAFSKRSQSSVKGYSLRPSFFCIPLKYMLAVLIRSARDILSAAGMGCRKRSLGDPRASSLCAGLTGGAAPAAAP